MTITDSRAAITSPTPTRCAPRGSDSHPTATHTLPNGASSGGDQLAGGHSRGDDRTCNAAGNQHTDRHRIPGTQSARAVGANSRSAVVHANPEAEPPSGAQPTDRQLGHDAQQAVAVGADGEQGQTAIPRATPSSVPLFDPALALAAEVLDDIERVRMANANRLLILTRSAEDSDGEVRGFGLDESHPDVARLAAMVELLKTLDKDATKNLEKIMRRHPLHAWSKTVRGVGDKQIARLLGAIGDPYIRAEWTNPAGVVVPEGPRTVNALWAYCGLDPRDGHAQKRKRGEKANWSTVAKTRAHLIAKSCLRQLVKPCTGAEHAEDCHCSPYRLVYDRRRTHTAVTHPEWTDGHSDNDALRVAAKEVLKDLWRAARAHHLGSES